MKPIRKVVCAANKYGDLIIMSARHHDKNMNDIIKAVKAGGHECKPEKGYQGFVDQFGVFMDRTEALAVATASGQPLDMIRNSGNGKVLYSEGLY